MDESCHIRVNETSRTFPMDALLQGGKASFVSFVSSQKRPIIFCRRRYRSLLQAKIQVSFAGEDTKDALSLYGIFMKDANKL